MTNKKLPDWIPKEKFELLLKAATEERNKYWKPQLKKYSPYGKKLNQYILAMILGYGAGLRISEIVGSDREVDYEYKDTKKKITTKIPRLTIDRFQDRFIKIYGKGQKERTTVLPGKLFLKAGITRAELKNILPIGDKDGQCYRALQHWFSKLTKKVLGKPMGFHSTRHSFASILAGSGKPLHEIQALTGHSRLDSVPDYTPVMIRKNGTIEIISIDDLWNKIDSEEIEVNNSFQKLGGEYHVFNRATNKNGGDYWTEIKQIHRHKYKGELITLNSAGGVVDISPNHSLVSINGKTMDASKMKVGDRLCIPTENNIGWRWGLRDSKDIGFIGDLDLAWLYGFFSAEGCVGNEREVMLCNSNIDLLNKCKEILKKNFYSSINILHKKDCSQVYLSDRRVAKFFRHNFYTSQKLKKVPSFILNSHSKVKLAFLEGYNMGDGYNKNKTGFHCFTSNSQVLMAGLLFLIKNTTKQDHNLFIREDKKNIIQMSFCDNGKGKLDTRKIKKVRKVNYKGWLYDLTTKDQTFCCGVGNIKVHNTLGIYLHANPEQAIKGVEDVF